MEVCRCASMRLNASHRAVNRNSKILCHEPAQVQDSGVLFNQTAPCARVRPKSMWFYFLSCDIMCDIKELTESDTERSMRAAPTCDASSTVVSSLNPTNKTKKNAFIAWKCSGTTRLSDTNIPTKTRRMGSVSVPVHPKCIQQSNPLKRAFFFSSRQLLSHR